MSSEDARVKKLLKKARQYLTEQEFEDCLDEVKDVLEIDQNNYLAHLFGGKAYHSLNQTDKAADSYRKAIEIDRSNLLAWKGLYLVVKNSGDYQQFFDFLQSYVEILKEKQEPLHELTRDIRVYNKDFNKKTHDQNMQAYYLRSILPDTNLGRELGPLIQPYDQTIESLLKLITPFEEKKVKDARRRFPLSITTEQQAELNKSLYSIYSTSEIPQLYKQFIEWTRDDDARYRYEDLNLQYTYELIKTMPDGQDKDAKFAKFIDEVKGMVTIRHPSQNAWQYYFDFVVSDVETLDYLDLDELCWYVSHFPSDKGLTSIIYAFLHSEISPFNIAEVTKRLKEISTSDEVSPQEAETADDDDTENEDVLSEKLEAFEEKDDSNGQLSSDEIISYFNRGSENSKDSLFGSRLCITYYIHTKEYLTASERSRAAVRTLANLCRWTSLRLPVFRRFLLLSLATIYTYFEAPKNFQKALELYEKVEAEDPGNPTVQIGKGFILIEKGDIETAKQLLKEAVKSTGNREALAELAWCQIKSNEIAEGRSSLEKIIGETKDSSAGSNEKRAMLMWRIAESYLIELKASHTSADDSDLLAKAYQYLIDSLKHFKTYAPSFTSLGKLYLTHYNDSAKAIKCFFKAFEIDNSEIDAAKGLVAHYAELQEWRMCEVICTRLLDNEHAKRIFALSSTEDDNNWAYRTLGICHLESQKYATSIEYLQNSIRLNKLDKVSWSCLGEAYLACGRLEAALKVFEHCLALTDPEADPKVGSNWYSFYMLALVQLHLGSYDDADKTLKGLFAAGVSETAVTKLHCQNRAAHAEYYISNGFSGRAVYCATSVIDTIFENRDNSELMESQLIWKSLSDALLIFVYTQSSVEKLDMTKLEAIVSGDVENEFLQGLKSVNVKEGDAVATAISYLIKTSSHAIGALAPGKPSRSLSASLYHNLGVNFLHAYRLSVAENSDALLANAIKSLRRAIQLQDTDQTTWIGLGIAALWHGDAALAQHSLIKSLTIDPKDPAVWTILALLYVRNDDFDLAKETFSRVQSIAPASASGWLGLAFLHDVSDDKELSWNMFSHGFILSNGRSTAAQLLYTHSIVQKTVKSAADKGDLDTVDELTVAKFAILSYLKNFPQDVMALNLALTIIERLGDYKKGIELAKGLCSILEEAYETSEDARVMNGFARAKATLGRLYLADQDYEQALECAQLALSLSEDSDSYEVDADQLEVVLSARVVIGLSLFFSNDFEGSIDQLKVILAHEQTQDHLKTTETLFVLIAQILYANGTEESVRAAVDELFTFIGEFGTSLLVALTLGAIAITKNLDDIIPAVKSDLLSLKLEQIASDRHRRIPNFIAEINRRSGLEDDTYTKRTAFMFPGDAQVWSKLSAQTSLSVASTLGQASSKLLAEKLITCGSLRQVQRGLFLDPCNRVGYESLALCLQ